MCDRHTPLSLHNHESLFCRKVIAVGFVVIIRLIVIIVVIIAVVLSRLVPPFL